MGDASRDAGAELSLLEQRPDGLVDDPFGGGIGQRPFQSLAHFNTQPMIVLSHQQQHAIIGLGTAELPGIHDANRVLLNLFGLRGSHDQHRYLRTFAGFKGCQILLEVGLLPRREGAGQISDSRFKLRYRR